MKITSYLVILLILSVRAHMACELGQYDEDGCQDCGYDYHCDGDERVACPLGSYTSTKTAQSIDDCIPCEEGFALYRSNGTCERAKMIKICKIPHGTTVEGIQNATATCETPCFDDASLGYEGYDMCKLIPNDRVVHPFSDFVVYLTSALAVFAFLCSICC